MNNPVRNNSGVLYSQKKASKKYESQLEHINLRLPEGTKELISEKISAEHPGLSINAYINNLIKKDLINQVKND